jgi:hypothetical protein
MNNTYTQEQKMMNSKIRIMSSKKIANAECSPREERLLKSNKSRRSQRAPRRSKDWESLTEQDSRADPFSYYIDNKIKADNDN